MNLCYECGLPIDPKDKNKEHIPQKCLYYGLQENEKKNLITIPAHIDCNNKYSSSDDILRDIIGLASDEETGLANKALKSFFHQPEKKILNSVSFEKDEAFINQNIDDIKNCHRKNFKGIFYKEYGLPLPDYFDITVLTDFDDGEEIQNGTNLTQSFLEMSEVKVDIPVQSGPPIPG
jgi:hypothetical protein